MNLHLFFDVYIEDAPLGVYLRGDRRRFNVDHKIRSSSDAYKYQTKFDITRYSLISYQGIDWKSVTIRIECQNSIHSSIYDELAAYFPRANIQRDRSDTAKKYYDSLNTLMLEDNAWIFFSPNNDHPLIGNANTLANVIQDADEAAVRTGAAIVSIPYSHYTECQNFFKPSHHEWGAYGNVFPKLLYETDYSYVISLNKMLLDSLHIYRFGDLKKIFGESKRGGRIIRPEDTEFYLKDTYKHVMVIPKVEFCRHYDGYMHIADKVPPLFIPNGFFESKIKIRYGYDENIPEFVNVNPMSSKFSYQHSSGADLKNLLTDFPSFWKKRICELDINPNFSKNLTPAEVPYYAELRNPWNQSIKAFNFYLSLRRLVKYFIKKKIRKKDC